MEKKVGRNDPCSCGSGKKYKQCCLKKAAEGAKTYTSTGKRKFKAKVIKVGEGSQSLFQSATAGAQTASDPAKFKATAKDFREKKKEEDLKFDAPQEKPETAEEAQPAAPSLGEEFKETQTDFREKKEKE